LSPAIEIAVVVPVYNAVPYLRRCLEALAASSCRAAECIVVDDGSTDDVGEVAAAFGARLVRLPERGGPARARNAGVAACTQALILFLDADVSVHTDTLARVRDWFTGAETVDAVFGSYDDSPAVPGLVSQYRNLLHCYTHHRARQRASTFWAGCGAIRRQVFEKAGGFRESYDAPSIEDIELGYRLTDGGARIVIDPDIQVTHLKRWTLGSVIRTDVLSRGIPWAELMLRRRNVPDDLNLRVSQRLSTVLAWLLVGVVGCAGVWSDARWLAGVPVLAAFLVALNADFYRFLARRRGWFFAAAAMPLHWLYHFYNGVSFAVALFRHWRRGSTA
jgi:glycosyltransferase involved in cell wall biosynthesis